MQIFGKYFSFLPLFLVCKLGVEFLGSKELCLVEAVHNRASQFNEGITDEYSRKVYVWTIYYNEQGEPIPNPFASKLEPDSYEGLNFSRLDRKQVIFF